MADNNAAFTEVIQISVDLDLFRAQLGQALQIYQTQFVDKIAQQKVPAISLGGAVGGAGEFKEALQGIQAEFTKLIEHQNTVFTALHDGWERTTNDATKALNSIGDLLDQTKVKATQIGVTVGNAAANATKALNSIGDLLDQNRPKMKEAGDAAGQMGEQGKKAGDAAAAGLGKVGEEAKRVKSLYEEIAAANEKIAAGAKDQPNISKFPETGRTQILNQVNQQVAGGENVTEFLSLENLKFLEANRSKLREELRDETSFEEARARLHDEVNGRVIQADQRLTALRAEQQAQQIRTEQLRAQGLQGTQEFKTAGNALINTKGAVEQQEEFVQRLKTAQISLAQAEGQAFDDAHAKRISNDLAAADSAEKTANRTYNSFTKSLNQQDIADEQFAGKRIARLDRLGRQQAAVEAQLGAAQQRAAAAANIAVQPTSENAAAVAKQTVLATEAQVAAYRNVRVALEQLNAVQANPSSSLSQQETAAEKVNSAFAALKVASREADTAVKALNGQLSQTGNLVGSIGKAVASGAPIVSAGPSQFKEVTDFETNRARLHEEVNNRIIASDKRLDELRTEQQARQLRVNDLVAQGAQGTTGYKTAATNLLTTESAVQEQEQLMQRLQTAQQSLSQASGVAFSEATAKRIDGDLKAADVAEKTANQGYESFVRSLSKEDLADQQFAAKRLERLDENARKQAVAAKEADVAQQRATQVNAYAAGAGAPNAGQAAIARAAAAAANQQVLAYEKLKTALIEVRALENDPKSTVSQKTTAAENLASAMKVVTKSSQDADAQIRKLNVELEETARLAKNVQTAASLGGPGIVLSKGGASAGAAGNLQDVTQLSGGFKQVKEDIDNVEKSGKTLTDSLTTGLLGTIGHVVKFAIAWRAVGFVIQEVEQLLAAPFKAVEEGIQYLKEVQVAADELTGVLQANVKFSDDLTQNFKLASVAAKDVVKNLQDIAIKDNLKFENLVNSFKALTESGGANFVTSVKDLVGLTELFNLAMKASGVSAQTTRRLVSEIPKALEGSLPLNSKLLEVLHLTAAQWTTIRNESLAHHDLLAQLEPRLKPYLDAVAQAQVHLAVQEETVDLIKKRWEGLIAGPLFERFIFYLRQLLDWLDRNKEKVDDLGQQLGKIVDYLAKLAIQLVNLQGNPLSSLALMAKYILAAAAGVDTLVTRYQQLQLLLDSGGKGHRIQDQIAEGTKLEAALEQRAAERAKLLAGLQPALEGKLPPVRVATPDQNVGGFVIPGLLGSPTNAESYDAYHQQISAKFPPQQPKPDNDALKKAMEDFRNELAIYKGEFAQATAGIQEKVAEGELSLGEAAQIRTALLKDEIKALDDLGQKYTANGGILSKTGADPKRLEDARNSVRVTETRQEEELYKQLQTVQAAAVREGQRIQREDEHAKIQMAIEHRRNMLEVYKAEAAEGLHSQQEVFVYEKQLLADENAARQAAIFQRLKDAKNNQEQIAKGLSELAHAQQDYDEKTLRAEKERSAALEIERRKQRDFTNEIRIIEQQAALERTQAYSAHTISLLPAPFQQIASQIAAQQTLVTQIRNIDKQIADTQAELKLAAAKSVESEETKKLIKTLEDLRQKRAELQTADVRNLIALAINKETEAQLRLNEATLKQLELNQLMLKDKVDASKGDNSEAAKNLRDEYAKREEQLRAQNVTNTALKASLSQDRAAIEVERQRIDTQQQQIATSIRQAIAALDVSKAKDRASALPVVTAPAPVTKQVTAAQDDLAVKKQELQQAQVTLNAANTKAIQEAENTKIAAQEAVLQKQQQVTVAEQQVAEAQKQLAAASAPALKKDIDLLTAKKDAEDNLLRAQKELNAEQEKLSTTKISTQDIEDIRHKQLAEENLANALENLTAVQKTYDDAVRAAKSGTPEAKTELVDATDELAITKREVQQARDDLNRANASTSTQVTNSLDQQQNAQKNVLALQRSLKNAQDDVKTATIAASGAVVGSYEAQAAAQQNLLDKQRALAEAQRELSELKTAPIGTTTPAAPANVSQAQSGIAAATEAVNQAQTRLNLVQQQASKIGKETHSGRLNDIDALILQAKAAIANAEANGKVTDELRNQLKQLELLRAERQKLNDTLRPPLPSEIKRQQQAEVSDAQTAQNAALNEAAMAQIAAAFLKAISGSPEGVGDQLPLGNEQAALNKQAEAAATIRATIALTKLTDASTALAKAQKDAQDDFTKFGTNILDLIIGSKNRQDLQDAFSGGDATDKITAIANSIAGAVQNLPKVIQQFQQQREAAGGGVLGTISAGAGLIASVDPEPISKAVLGAISGITGLIGGFLTKAAKRIGDEVRKGISETMDKYAAGQLVLGSTIVQLEKERNDAISRLSGKKGGKKQLDEILPNLDRQIAQLKKQQEDIQHNFEESLLLVQHSGSDVYQKWIQDWIQINKQVKEYLDAMKDSAGYQDAVNKANQFLNLQLAKQRTDLQKELNEGEKQAIQDAMQLNQLLDQRSQLIKDYNQKEYDILNAGALERRRTAAVEGGLKLQELREQRDKQLQELDYQIKLNTMKVDAERQVFHIATDTASLQQESLRLQLLDMDALVQKWKDIQSILANTSGLSAIGGAFSGTSLLPWLSAIPGFGTTTTNTNNVTVNVYNPPTGFNGAQFGSDLNSYLTQQSRYGYVI